jgi:outer membrane protein insertion porin family
MRTDAPHRTRGASSARTAAFALACLLSVLPSATRGQVPANGGEDADAGSDRSFFLYDDETTVEAVDFRFVGQDALGAGRLRGAIDYDGPGALAGVRSALDFLPFVSAPDREQFSPLTLQRDVVRMRHLYRSAGYPEAAIDYEVEFDSEENAVSVTFVIDEGQPVTMGDLEIRVVEELTDSTPTMRDEQEVAPPLEEGRPGSVPGSLPDHLVPRWEELRAELEDLQGEVFGDGLRTRLDDRATDWLRWYGYPWGSAQVTSPDTVERSATVRLNVLPGPRARVDSIAIEGNVRLSDHVLRREVPFTAGEWYDFRAVSAAERELFELALVHRALGDVPTQPHDSTVTVRLRVNESQPRLVWARAGWRSESGISGEAHWTHRDFFGGARTFTASVNGETGIGALEVTRSRTVGASIMARQPYVWHRSISASVGPFVRFRDDFRDRSLLFGVGTTLLYRHSALETLSLHHELSRTRVDDAFQLLPVSQLAADGDSAFAPVFVKSVFSLTARYGTLDDRLSPRSGFFVQPSAEVTGPSGVSDVEFFRLAVDGLLAIPLTDQVAIFLEGAAGRLFPFGKSDPAQGDFSTRAVAGLRDVLFTAGGTSELRGWARGLAGPKIPDVVVAPDGTVGAERYIPVGGLARITANFEVELPFPFLPREHRTYTFFDAGRVWSPGDALQPADPELAVAPWLYAVGGGLQFSTIAGPVRIGVGYKLNPTRIDLLPPAAVARALAAGEGLSGIETDSSRRWHLLLSIGRGL